MDNSSAERIQRTFVVTISTCSQNISLYSFSMEVVAERKLAAYWWCARDEFQLKYFPICTVYTARVRVAGGAHSRRDRSTCESESECYVVCAMESSRTWGEALCCMLREAILSFAFSALYTQFDQINVVASSVDTLLHCIVFMRQRAKSMYSRDFIYSFVTNDWRS